MMIGEDNNMKVTDKHVLFWGGIFSNFEPAPFVENGMTFLTNEHYFMYHKAMFFKDYTSAEEVFEHEHPAGAKKVGRGVQNFDADKWKGVCRDFMKQGLRLKFGQHPELLKELLKYPNHSFVEASPRDFIWGIGMAEDHPDADNELTWKGSNWLGQCLDEVRDEFLKT